MAHLPYGLFSSDVIIHHPELPVAFRNQCKLQCKLANSKTPGFQALDELSRGYQCKPVGE
jgi:hypothetical protein